MQATEWLTMVIFDSLEYKDLTYEKAKEELQKKLYKRFPHLKRQDKQERRLKEFEKKLEQKVQKGEFPFPKEEK